MGRLTTHVLDTAQGRPAAGLAVALLKLDRGDAVEPLATARTNSDGRCDAPLLEGEAFSAGVYELQFRVGEYFSGAAPAKDGSPDPAFLDTVVIRFGVSDPSQHYHVPLLVSPYGYSTYRGS